MGALAVAIAAGVAAARTPWLLRDGSWELPFEHWLWLMASCVALLVDLVLLQWVSEMTPHAGEFGNVAGAAQIAVLAPPLRLAHLMMRSNLDRERVQRAVDIERIARGAPPSDWRQGRRLSEAGWCRSIGISAAMVVVALNVWAEQGETEGLNRYASPPAASVREIAVIIGVAVALAAVARFTTAARIAPPSVAAIRSPETSWRLEPGARLTVLVVAAVAALGVLPHVVVQRGR